MVSGEHVIGDEPEAVDWCNELILAAAADKVG